MNEDVFFFLSFRAKVLTICYFILVLFGGNDQVI